MKKLEDCRVFLLVPGGYGSVPCVLRRGHKSDHYGFLPGMKSVVNGKNAGVRQYKARIRWADSRG